MIRIATASGFTLAEVGTLLEAVADGASSQAALAALAGAKLPELEAQLARTTLLVALMRAATACRCPSLSECVARAEAAGVG